MARPIRATCSCGPVNCKEREADGGEVEERHGVGGEERVEGDQRERRGNLLKGAEGRRIRVCSLCCCFFVCSALFYQHVKDLIFSVSNCVWMSRKLSGV